VTTYSAGVNLVAGKTYTLQLTGGSSAALSGATPSDLAPGIARAVAAARAADTAVVVVCDDTESEAADRASLNLPSAQDELISAVATANPHTVVVIDAGSPVLMRWLNHLASVIDAWYPGESNGAALAAVLFGTIDPSGHLPVTFPSSLSQMPASSPGEFPGTGGKVRYSEGIDVGYRYYELKGETPLFGFGYGLSYTSFRFGRLTLTPEKILDRPRGAGRSGCRCGLPSQGLVTVSATVTNTGRLAGADVGPALPGRPGGGRRAGPSAQKLHQGMAQAGPVRSRPVNADGARPVVLERPRQRLGGARRAVPGLHRGLVGPGQPPPPRQLHLGPVTVPGQPNPRSCSGAVWR
jgi:beta-glucosidase